MSKKVVFGLIGAKTCGKSTVSKLIQKLSVNPFTESALAGKLKRTCAQVWHMEPIIFEDQRYKELPFKWWSQFPVLGHSEIASIFKEYGFDVGERKYWAAVGPLVGQNLESPRHILQLVGTEVLRALGDPDIHCKTISLGERTIISDLRFCNEFDFFSKDPEIEFHAIYIKRDEAESKVDKYMAHRSETEYHQFKDQCHLLENNGSLEDLEEQLTKILYKIQNIGDVG